MNPVSIWCLAAMTAYFLVLVAISFYRARKATLNDYYIGDRNSTWWLVTLGMIGDSVSGVTYISVPGMVIHQDFSYLQVVMGYFLGYLLVTFILLPLYYRLKLISIYSYVGDRFGSVAQKTASFLFIASRTFGSAARLYLAVLILHQFLFGSLFTPLISFFATIALIFLYTYKGGIKSLVWTEAFQSVFLVAGVAVVFGAVFVQAPNAVEAITTHAVFFFDPNSSHFFLKQIIGGIFITTAMNGLDQNIMQINLSCRSLKDAQKNFIASAFILVFVNFLFLVLGAMCLQIYQTRSAPLPASDQLLPNLVLEHLGLVPILFFILGLTAASFSSASSVMTAIASSIEIDLLPARLKNKINVRAIHAAVGGAILCMIYLLHLNQTQSLIAVVLTYAGYTYGPLLGLFALGIFTKLEFRGKLIPWVAGGAIAITAMGHHVLRTRMPGYQMGVEILPINATIFCAGMMLIRKRA